MADEIECFLDNFVWMMHCYFGFELWFWIALISLQSFGNLIRILRWFSTTGDCGFCANDRDFLLILGSFVGAWCFWWNTSPGRFRWIVRSAGATERRPIVLRCGRALRSAVRPIALRSGRASITGCCKTIYLVLIAGLNETLFDPWFVVVSLILSTLLRTVF